MTSVNVRRSVVRDCASQRTRASEPLVPTPRSRLTRITRRSHSRRRGSYGAVLPLLLDLDANEVANEDEDEDGDEDEDELEFPPPFPTKRDPSEV